MTPTIEEEIEAATADQQFQFYLRELPQDWRTAFDEVLDTHLVAQAYYRSELGPASYAAWEPLGFTALVMMAKYFREGMLK